MTSIPSVVAAAGVPWPEDDPNALRSAAGYWDALGDSLKQIATIGDRAADRLGSCNEGAGMDACRALWATLAKTCDHEAAAMAHRQADLCREYANVVGAGQSKLMEFACIIAATLAAGAALSVVTGFFSSAGAVAIAAGLVARAALYFGVTLSSTVATLVAGAIGAVLLDLAVAQPMRIYKFHDGGWSLPEAGLSAVTGGAAAKFSSVRQAATIRRAKNAAYATEDRIAALLADPKNISRLRGQGVNMTEVARRMIDNPGKVLDDLERRLAGAATPARVHTPGPPTRQQTTAAVRREMERRDPSKSGPWQPWSSRELDQATREELTQRIGQALRRLDPPRK